VTCYICQKLRRQCSWTRDPKSHWLELGTLPDFDIIVVDVKSPGFAEIVDEEAEEWAGDEEIDVVHDGHQRID
jgi:hypothetical protein